MEHSYLQRDSAHPRNQYSSYDSRISGTQSMLEADRSVSRSMFFKNIVALNFADESVCLCAFQVWPSGQDVFDTMNMTFTIIFLALGQQSPGVLVKSLFIM